MPIDIDAIVLAGGLGTRLRDVLPDGCPKAMAPIEGRPFVQLLVERLYGQGVRRVIFSLGYGAGQIVDFVRSRNWPPDLALEYAIEPAPLGTGGGLRFASSHLRSELALAMNGDTICDVDLGRLVDFHRERHAAITVVAMRVAETGRYGLLECEQDGKVVRFAEKQAFSGPGLINCGVYVVSSAFMLALPQGRAYSWENEVLAPQVGRGLYAMEAATRFLDIGMPESLFAAASFLNERTTIQ